MKTPAWYKEAVAAQGELVAAGAMTQADAAKAVAEAIVRLAAQEPKAA